MSRIIGIDFGTSYSLVAAGGPEGLKIFGDPKHSKDSLLFPSVVSANGNRSMLVGWEAVENQKTHPTLTLPSIKRWMGRDSGEIKASGDYIPCPLQQNRSATLQIKLAGKLWDLAEVASFIFKALKERAEFFLKDKVHKAVIAVPACLQAAGRSEIQKAAGMAGLQVVSILEDGEAVNFAYATKEPNRGLVAVYNFGGGVFEVSIAQVQEGKVRILATQGDPRLGGMDIDWTLAKFFLEEIKQAHSPKASEDPVVIQRVLDEAERAKCAVSHRGSYDLKIKDEKQKWSFTRAFSRFELRTLVASLVEKTIPLCEKALQEAKVAREDLQELILVGGTSRMPFVRESAESFFGRKAYEGLSSDQAVVAGVAAYGQKLMEESKD